MSAGSILLLTWECTEKQNFPNGEATDFPRCAQLAEDEDFEPEELWRLGPRDLSYWVASQFRENPQQQQILLQVLPPQLLALPMGQVGD